MARLRDIGEVELIRGLVRAAHPPGTPLEDDAVLVGPGDDAAIVRPETDRELVVTTDAFVSGGHWLDDWIHPDALGVRFARANLSDLAAMAARPRWATLAMGLRRDRDEEWAERVEAGLATALAIDGARLVGGNVCAVESEEWLCLTLIGEAVTGRAWLRSTARAGDLLAVTGYPGRAGAAVALIGALGEGMRAARWQPLLDAWQTPASRVDFARALAASGAVTAAIDLSDGLGGDLLQLAEASGVGAEIAREKLPADPALEAAAKRLGRDAFTMRLAPSDDYELLLAVDPAKQAIADAIAGEAGVPLGWIGRLTDTPARLEWVADGERGAIDMEGFDHFAPAARPNRPGGGSDPPQGRQTLWK